MIIFRSEKEEITSNLEAALADKDFEAVSIRSEASFFYLLTIMENDQMTFFIENTITGKGQPVVSQDINVLALVKGEERYIFLYNENNRAETLRVLGRYASNPNLSFTWYDAAVLSQRIRQESQQQAREKQQGHSDRYIALPTENDFGV